MNSKNPRTVVLALAAEFEYRRLVEAVPDFEEAWDACTAAVSANPLKGSRMAGGRWGYALANRDRPAVRIVYTFHETEIRVLDVQATPAERPPSAV